MDVRSLGYGRIAFVAGADPVPETVEETATGNSTVRVVSPATPGVPPRFDVQFFISCTHEVAGRSVHNAFHWDTSVPAEDRSTPYSEVELAAARMLPASLREIADALQAEIDRTDAGGSEKT
ncbi:hypothetical protein [Defluviimonas sp. SAOS-178_SWC]|uniref:hypothetical protein n=1 Tax=Defluviimonas sp. SAOS-178_SWC TaxID=3121287 RepID=UPI0032213A25